MAVNVDRFSALHLPLRYQEPVTHKPVVIVVIVIWVYSAFVSLMILWGLDNTRDLFILFSEAFGLMHAFVVYIRIYLTVR